MNKISVFLEHLYEISDDIDKAIKLAKNIGITALECDYNRLNGNEGLKECFLSNDISVSCIYRFFDFLHDDEDICKSEIEKTVTLATHYNAKKILAVPGFYRDSDDKSAMNKRVASMLNYMSDIAEQEGVTIVLEDFDDEKSPCFNSKGLLYFMENCPKVKLAFDTGNFIVANEDAIKLFDKLEQYVVHIHCKDRAFIPNNTREEQEEKLTCVGKKLYPSPSCYGEIGLREIISKAKTSGYKGVYAIEHFGASNQLDYMEKSYKAIISCM